MSLSEGSVKAVTIVFAATLSMASYVFAQDGLATPQAFAAAKHGSVEQFASSFAQAKTPVGVVLLQQDFRAKTTQLTLEDQPKVLTPEATIGAFEARHSEYRIERTGAGVVIAPRTAGWCSRPLRSHLKSLSTSGEAFEVLYRVFRTWSDDQGPYVPPGIVGREDRRPDTYRLPVTVDLINSSLENALNEVVRQAPGLGWAVREVTLASSEQGTSNSRPKTIPGCNVALLDGVGWLETSWTLGVVASLQ